MQVYHGKLCGWVKPSFCPLVFRTKQLEELAAMNLAGRAKAVVGGVPRDLPARTGAFLLLKDSKSSYAIECAHAPGVKCTNHQSADVQVGRMPLSAAE
jgi:hypothetical protein